MCRLYKSTPCNLTMCRLPLDILVRLNITWLSFHWLIRILQILNLEFWMIIMVFRRNAGKYHTNIHKCLDGITDCEMINLYFSSHIPLVLFHDLLLGSCCSIFCFLCCHCLFFCPFYVDHNSVLHKIKVPLLVQKHKNSLFFIHYTFISHSKLIRPIKNIYKKMNDKGILSSRGANLIL